MAEDDVKKHTLSLYISLLGCVVDALSLSRGDTSDDFLEQSGEDDYEGDDSDEDSYSDGDEDPRLREKDNKYSLEMHDRSQISDVFGELLDFDDLPATEGGVKFIGVIRVLGLGLGVI